MSETVHPNVEIPYADFPSCRTDILSARSLKKAYVRLYVSEYAKAYAKDTKVPVELTPFKKVIRSFDQIVDTKKTIQTALPKNPPTVLKYALDELAYEFENSGSLRQLQLTLNVVDSEKSHAKQIEDLQKDISEMNKKIAEIKPKAVASETISEKKSSKFSMENMAPILVALNFIFLAIIGVNYFRS